MKYTILLVGLLFIVENPWVIGFILPIPTFDIL